MGIDLVHCHAIINVSIKATPLGEDQMTNSILDALSTVESHESYNPTTEDWAEYRAWLDGELAFDINGELASAAIDDLGLTYA